MHTIIQSLIIESNDKSNNLMIKQCYCHGVAKSYSELVFLTRYMWFKHLLLNKKAVSNYLIDLLLVLNHM